jgi:hypothetical protein
MKKFVCAVLAGAALIGLALCGPAIRAQVFVEHDKSGTNSDSKQPLISGTTVGNTGCAVLEKHTPVKGPLLALGVIYARTQYVVLDTYHCKLDKEKYTGPDDIKALNQTAVSNKIKLVVIPSHYTDEELQQAKDICKAPGGTSSSQPTSSAANP